MRISTLRQRIQSSVIGCILAASLCGSVAFVGTSAIERISALQELAASTSELLAHRIRLGDVDLDDDSWSAGILRNERLALITISDSSGSLHLVTPQGIQSSVIAHYLGLQQSHRFALGQRSLTVTTHADTSSLLIHILFLLVGSSLFVVSTVVLGRYVTQRTHQSISTQLLDLSSAVNAVSSRRDYSIRALRRSDDEIGILADTLNHMLTQVELQDLQLKDEVERAEAAKIAKSQFLATMSHEIRTPINGILGMTQLMLDTELNSEQNDFIRTVARSAEGLLSIINDILDFSKGEAGRHQIEHAPFELTRVIDDCIETVAIVACEKKLELVCQVDENAPPVLRGDAARIRQVLLNLLSNALKFTTEGEIIIRVKLQDRSDKAVTLHFEVQDTGIGIPENRLDRLFKSFSQVEASNNRQYGGTGLGLAICKQLVEAMGGGIYVRTAAGAGALFGFKLTLDIDQQGSDQESQPSPNELRILVADPNTTSRSAITQMLRKGNQVVTATNGAEGRQLLLNATREGNPFDLVLLDVRLSDAFLAPSTSEVDPPPVPLIMLAPVNQLAAASVVEWHGHISCLAKPVRRQDLAWCISESSKPMARESGKESEVRETPKAVISEKRILIAEDNPVNQKITCKFLDKMGAPWELVENGQEAIKAFRTGEHSLILMDVQMPVMDGLEATGAIRRLEVLSETHIPIIALTANVLEDDRNRAYRAGFDDYLVKPIKLEELEKTVLKWLARGQMNPLLPLLEEAPPALPSEPPTSSSRMKLTG